MESCPSILIGRQGAAAASTLRPSAGGWETCTMRTIRTFLAGVLSLALLGPVAHAQVPAPAVAESAPVEAPAADVDTEVDVDGAPGVRLDAADLEAWLDGLLPYVLEQNDVAGSVVVVVKDGRVLLEKGYG